MNRFNEQALQLAKNCIFNDTAYLIVGLSTLELEAAYRGTEKDLEFAMRRAIKRDPSLRRILTRAMQPEPEPKPAILQNHLTLTEN